MELVCLLIKIIAAAFYRNSSQVKNKYDFFLNHFSVIIDMISKSWSFMSYSQDPSSQWKI